MIKSIKSDSEVTAILTIEITDIVRKLPNDEEKALKLTEKETDRLLKAIRKLSGVDKVDIKSTKIFPNIKSED